MMMIGIDPGVNTGIAVWDKDVRKLQLCAAMPIHAAMDLVKAEHLAQRLHSVVFEDARLRTGYFGPSSRAKAQGAGSVKRDCTIWADYLGALGIPYRTISPRQKGAKVDAERFKAMTGWQAQTNEHGRDAAMLVIGR